MATPTPTPSRPRPSKVMRHLGWVDLANRSPGGGTAVAQLLSRQAGKSHGRRGNRREVEALFVPATRYCSSPCARPVHQRCSALSRFPPAVRPMLGEAANTFRNLSRIVCLLPRGSHPWLFAVSLLIIDEAARVPDDLYQPSGRAKAVNKTADLPMSALRQKASFTTPGAWANGGTDWAHRGSRRASPYPGVPRRRAA